MNTDRVYDIPTGLVLLVLLLMAIAYVFAIYSPTYAMFPSEITGAWMVALTATIISGVVVYKWVYGTKLVQPAFSR